MIKHHLRELTKSFGSQIDPEKSEELKRTKTDIENNLTRVLKLIQNEDQSKKDENPRKNTELVGLIEDFYNQYQSLYALYGRLTGEYVKAVPHKGRRLSSVSSSSSDSEYFSSEEGDSNNRRPQIENHNAGGSTEVNDQSQRLISEKKQHSNNENTHEVVVKTLASITEAKELEEQLNSQMKELESLNHEKRNLELQVERQAQEVKQLSSKNTKLHARVFELQLLLKKTEGTLTVLHAKLKNNEDQAVSKITELMARINKLEQEAKSLRSHKGKMEEKIRRSRNEALSQKKDLMDQLNVMQQNYDSACSQNRELEAELENKRERVSEHLVRIESLEGNLVKASSAEQCMVKERECFLARIKDLELELESRCSKQNELEKQLRETSCETTRLKEEERKALQHRNHELERAMAQREEDGATIEALDVTTVVDDVRLELELQNGRSQNEYSESLAKLEAQVAYQKETIKKQAESIVQIHAKNKQAEKFWSKKLKLNQQLAERKIEELSQVFRKKMEDNIRLLHQRIHVAEQLNNENKNSYKVTKQRYEEENKMLREKVANYEDELRTLEVKGTPSQVVSDLDGLGLTALNGLESDFAARKKVEEHREHVLSLVSKMLGEVQFAKDWIKKRNGEMKELKGNVDRLTVLLGEKEKQELLLREKVWKLEASVSKEGGEKLNLVKAVSQLERKARKLEKSLKEKDEDLVALGEKKREAIRQLCFLIEFHRQRYYDRLKDFVPKTIRATNRTQV